MDEILVAIDALNPGQLNKRGNHKRPSSFIGGFGVFDSTEASDHDGHLESLAVTQPLELSQDAARSPLISCDTQNFNFGGISGNTQSGIEATAPVTAPSSLEQPCTIEGHFIDPFDENINLASPEENTDLFKLGQSEALVLQNDAPISSPDHNVERDDLSPIIPRSISPAHLNSNERLLMYYYTTKVVHIFPVLDSPKSPWKTFHLPRVLQSAGEMTIHGSTSQIRSALRNT